MPSTHRILLLARSASPEEPRLPSWLIRRLLRIARNPIHPAAVLAPEEIRAAFQDHNEQFPPIMTLEQAARLAHIHPGSLKRWLGKGRFRSCVRRGKPLLFWRDKFIGELMRG